MKNKDSQISCLEILNSKSVNILYN